MNKLQTINTTDFKINKTTGEAYISIRKTAELLDLDESSVRGFIKTTYPEYDRKQGLTPEILAGTVNNYANKLNTNAVILQGKLAEAGAKAFIYHQAGYTLTATPQLPDFSDPVVAAKAWIKQYEESQARQVLIDMQGVQITEDAVLTAKSDLYYPVYKLIEMGIPANGKLLTRVSMEMGFTPRNLYSAYQTINPKTYHVDVINAVYDINLP